MDLNHARLPIPPLRPVVAFIVNPGGPTLVSQTSIFLRACDHVKPSPRSHSEQAAELKGTFRIFQPTSLAT
jgi:hypothetical protein